MTTPLQDREALIRFFVDRPALPVKEAADLLGWPAGRLLAQARDEGALLTGGRVAWDEVAFWLLQVWPRAALLEAPGAYSRFIPPELHLTEVTWRPPLSLVRALEWQAALQWRRRAEMYHTTIEDYVADELHLILEPESLPDDPAFREAYDYPA